MSDQKTTIQELKNKVEQLVVDREWQKFHDAKNLSMDIAAEAAELMEHFLWLNNEESSSAVTKHSDDITAELSDIVFGVLAFCNRYNIDLSTSLTRKIDEIGKKYPVDKAKGRREKYNKL